MLRSLTAASRSVGGVLPASRANPLHLHRISCSWAVKTRHLLLFIALQLLCYTPAHKSIAQAPHIVQLGARNTAMYCTLATLLYGSAQIHCTVHISCDCALENKFIYCIFVTLLAKAHAIYRTGATLPRTRAALTRNYMLFSAREPLSGRNSCNSLTGVRKHWLFIALEPAIRSHFRNHHSK